MPCSHALPTSARCSPAGGRPFCYHQGKELNFKKLAQFTHRLGLKLGVWHIRGAPQPAVDRRMPVKGTSSTIDQLVWTNASCPESEKNWCKCSWAKEMLGIDVKQL